MLAEEARALREAVERSWKGRGGREREEDVANLLWKGLGAGLTRAEITDTAGQVVVYGLLAARSCASGGGLPREVLEVNRVAGALLAWVQTGRLGGEARDVAGRTEELLGEVALPEVFGEGAGEAGKTEPLVDFYESFLASYRPEARRGRGVFCTPRAVVTALVESLDQVVRERWGLERGLASVERRTFDGREDYAVRVLDPAAGSGAFLAGVVRRIHKTLHDECWAGLTEAQRDARWQEYVRRDLLPRLHGFELMPAACAIGRLLLTLTLAGTGYRFRGDERIGIHRTNALDPPADDEPSGLGEAQRLKRDGHVTVVVGNPPYAGRSANLAPEHRRWIARYRLAASNGSRVRNALQAEKNINDDYVKFLAFAEELVGRHERAAVGLVTNHSYIDGEYYAGLRASLLRSFDEVWCLDLHGNRDKQEPAPGGGEDENVFRIATGVALLVGVKDGSGPHPGRLRCGDLWGSRDEKFARLTGRSLRELTRPVRPRAPGLVFRGAEKTEEEFLGWASLAEVLPEYSAATETGFDRLLLDFDRDALVAKVRRFAGDPDDPLRAAAMQRGRGLAARLAREPERLDAEHPERYVRRIQFRPYDYRWAWIKRDCVKTHALANMQRLSPGRPGLATTGKSQGPFAALAVGGLFAHKLLQAYDRTLVFPGPGDVEELHYLAAVLQAPGYGQRYARSLRTSLPRVPRARDEGLAEELRRLGADLAAANLLDAEYPHASWNREATECPFAELPSLDAGSDRVMAKEVRYDPRERALYLNRAQALRCVSSEAAEFAVGSFPVLPRWLRHRDGRVLSHGAREELRRAAAAVEATIRIRRAVEAVIGEYGGWPRAFRGGGD